MYLTNSDRYGDDDVPEIDYEPYQDNRYRPHPQTNGDNRAEDDSEE